MKCVRQLPGSDLQYKNLPKQVGNQNSASLLRWTTFGSFKRCHTHFSCFSVVEYFWRGCFVPAPRLLHLGAATPLPLVTSLSAGPRASCQVCRRYLLAEIRVFRRRDVHIDERGRHLSGTALTNRRTSHHAAAQRSVVQTI